MPNEFDELKQMLETFDSDKGIDSMLKSVDAYEKSEKEKKEERDKWLKTLKMYGGAKASCVGIFNACNTLNPVDPESPEGIYSIYKGRVGLKNLYKSLLPAFGNDKKITFSFGEQEVTINIDELSSIISKTEEYAEQCMRSWAMHPYTKKLMQEDYLMRTECQRYFSD